MAAAGLRPRPGRAERRRAPAAGKEGPGGAARALLAGGGLRRGRGRPRPERAEGRRARPPGWHGEAAGGGSGAAGGRRGSLRGAGSSGEARRDGRKRVRRPVRAEVLLPGSALIKQRSNVGKHLFFCFRRLGCFL